MCVPLVPSTVARMIGSRVTAAGPASTSLSALAYSRATLSQFRSPLLMRASSSSSGGNQTGLFASTGGRLLIAAGLVGVGYVAGNALLPDMRQKLTVPKKEEFVPIVICGPSGSGKSTLLKRLFNEFPDKFGFSVSHTTRKPRPGEVNGKDYHFVTKEEMVKGIEAGNFIESAQFSGNYYGTSFAAIDDVLNSNRNVILDIDMQGVQTLQTQLASGAPKLTKRPQFIFLAPPSVEELEKRLRGRGTENEDSLNKRLDAAKRELAWGLKGKESGLDVVVVNDNVDVAYNKLKSFLNL